MKLEDVYSYYRFLREELKEANVKLIELTDDTKFDELCDLPSTYDVSKHGYYIPMSITEIRNGELICKGTGEDDDISEITLDEISLGEMFHLCSHLEEYHAFDFTIDLPDHV